MRLGMRLPGERAHVDDQELQIWIDRWSVRYPAAWDAALEPLAGNRAFSHDDLEVLYRWKFRGLWPQRKINLMRAFPEHDVASLSRRAFACSDELGALVILTLIPGARAAGASAILTAHDPARYTVMDGRALQSLIALKLWSEDQGVVASCLAWPDYLAVCRALANRVERSLRTVDRALWTANGRAAAPDGTE
jgi:hypothetical protein